MVLSWPEEVKTRRKQQVSYLRCEQVALSQPRSGPSQQYRLSSAYTGTNNSGFGEFTVPSPQALLPLSHEPPP